MFPIYSHSSLLGYSVAVKHARLPCSETARLSRTMSSRKLQALDFIKRYFLEWGHSPTLSEISAELGISAKRAHELVHQLAAQKMIEHLAGKTRGIRLIDHGDELSEADVLVRLSALGWSIGLGDKIVRPPGDGAPRETLSETVLRALTEKGLHALPQLDHEPIDLDEAGTDGSTDCKKPKGA